MRRSSFNFADFDVRSEIDKRVALEDMKRWGQQITPAFTPVPDTTDYAEPAPPVIAVYNFVKGLRP